MNRLVIIGNGFDLAHGLPTSYGHFIDDYWKTTCDTKGKKIIKYNDELVSLNCEFGGSCKMEEFNLIDNIKEYAQLKDFITRNTIYGHGKFSIEFKNLFFEKICKNSIENWVDIENEYYRELKKIVKSTSLSVKGKKLKIIALNQEFEEVKNRLETYLSKSFDEVYNFDDILKLEIIDHLKSNPRRSDFLFEKEEKNFYQETESLKLGKTVLLSFNYTETVLDYSNFILKKDFEIEYNYIHGKMKVKELPIIFGFGDEMDDDYKEIENIDDNEYLKYFKSIQYLEHSTYKKLYNFIEAEPFQVFVFGHSCGLSDRTLLSTIFENNNCFSVKVFYYERKDGSDNYTELVQNISRHFRDKKMLRKKVVEKRHCKPLIKFVDKENGSL